MATPKKKIILKSKPSSVPSAVFKGDTGEVPEDKQPSLPPIEVIPLDRGRDEDGRWSLTVPPISATARAVKALNARADEGVIHIPDEHIEALARAAVDPTALARAPIERQRVDDGWFHIVTTRLFTPMTDVSLANDRWVADAIYAADPATKTNVNKFSAVPMPESHEDYSALVYGSDASHLVNAAELNFKKVLSENRQEVGRRLIEQPVTLTPTIVETSAKNGATVTSYSWTTADGNCRVSSALDRLDVLVEWLPPGLREYEPFKSIPDGKTVKLTPTVLMNMTLSDKRTLSRKIARRANDRLLLPTKAETARGYVRDRAERNAAAAALNALTVPARVIVGWDDDDDTKHMSRFASAVRSLLVQMNVEGQPLGDAAREGVRAEEIVTDLFEQGVIDANEREVLLGQREITAAMKALKLNPDLPDLRAAFVFQRLTANDLATRRIMRQRLRGDGNLYPAHRSKPIVELVVRSYTATLEDGLVQVRNALDSGVVWTDLVHKPWTVYNADTDERIDDLVEAAIAQVDAGGQAVRFLGVLGLMALTTSGHLIAPGASAKALVNDAEVDRSSVGVLVGRLCQFDWGLRLLGDAIKRTRAGRTRLRTVDKTGKLVETDAEATRAHFNAHLRLLVREGNAVPLVIPGSAEENIAWTKFAAAVVEAREKLQNFRDLRAEAGTTTKLDWNEAEATVKSLRSMASTVANRLTVEPEDDA